MDTHDKGLPALEYVTAIFSTLIREEGGSDDECHSKQCI